jgi:hypothetical protein
LLSTFPAVVAPLSKVDKGLGVLQPNSVISTGGAHLRRSGENPHYAGIGQNAGISPLRCASVEMTTFRGFG